METPKAQKNADFVNLFQMLVYQFSSQSKGSRASYFKRVVKFLKNLDVDLSEKNYLQLLRIEGIGWPVASRIKEILKTGELSEISITVENLAKEKVIEDLMTIHGIGRSEAKFLWRTGMRSKEEYFKRHSDIPEVMYYDDMQKRIPRDEVEEIEKKLKEIIRRIDRDLKITICGSYRRGKKDCGDIDVLLIDNLNRKGVLASLVDRLTMKKFLFGSLSHYYSSKYMGFCKVREYARRIDIRYVDKKFYATSLLYFTGSGPFNQWMRSVAKKKGFKLNEYGLYKLNKSVIKATDSSGNTIEYNANRSMNRDIMMRIDTERDIFEYLGLDYVSPEKREMTL